MQNTHKTAKALMFLLALPVLLCAHALQAQDANTNGFVKFSMSSHQNCAIRADGSAACSIYGPYDRFGVPSNFPDLIDIAAGSAHTCGLQRSGQISCWGDNELGQLNAPTGDQRFVSITASKYSFHSCGFTDDQQLVCWGLDTNGQSTPPNDGYGFIGVTLFYQSTCGVRTDGNVECWGDGLFNGAQVYEGSFAKLVNRRIEGGCGLLSSGEFLCLEQTRQYLPGQYSDVLSTGTHFCGLRTDGTLRCDPSPNQNRNVESPVASASANDRFIAIDNSSRRICALRTDGEILCFGTPENFSPPGNTQNPVPQPLGLNAIAYSNNELELNWQSVRGPFPVTVVGYDVYRNGELLTFTENGSSYIDSTVEPGVDYQYSILAVDGQDRRSEPSAEVSINTENRNGAASSSYVVPARPGEPSNLTSIAYGDGLVELSWARPTSGGVSGYEIRRNGSHYSYTRGVSFVDDGVAAGNCYHYEIVAVNDDGDIRGFASINQAVGESVSCLY